MASGFRSPSGLPVAVNMATTTGIMISVVAVLETIMLSIAVATMKRSEEHTSELQSLMRISYAVFCLKKQKKQKNTTKYSHTKQNKIAHNKQINYTTRK